MRISVFLFLILIFPVLAIAQESPPTHTVRAGETLFSISRQYDVSVQELREWNNLPDNIIHVGQRLFLGDRRTPEADVDTEDDPHTIIHVVEPGQTLYRIARLYDVDLNDLITWNDLRSSALTIGQELVIYEEPVDRPVDEDTPEPDETRLPEDEMEADPEQTQKIEEDADRVDMDTIAIPEEDAEDTGLYEVRAGDTLFRIASRFNMSVDDLMTINNLDDTDLTVGQRLRVHRRLAPPPSIAAEWDMESTPQGRFVTYTVSENDSIEDLLRYHHMDEREFRALNPGLSPSGIRPGDEITLLLSATSSLDNPYRVSVSGDDQASMIEVSRYPDDRHGRTTTSGDLYNRSALTAAHPGLSLGSVVYVENPETGHGIFVLINDRTSDNRLLLSDGAFRALQYTHATQLVARVYEDVP